MSTLQYLKSVGCVIKSACTEAAARGGHLDALKYFIQEGCATNAGELAKAAAAGGNVQLMRWLRSSHQIRYGHSAVVAAIKEGHGDALQYLVGEQRCGVTYDAWQAAV